MPLFQNKSATSVVTPQDIKDLTGIRATDLYFDEKTDPEQALDDLLKTWIGQISSHIEVRLNYSVSESDVGYDAIKDIVVRTVAKLVAVSLQQRTSPIIQIDDYAISVINTSDVIKDLNKELKPFKKRKVSVFWSSQEFNDTTK